MDGLTVKELDALGVETLYARGVDFAIRFCYGAVEVVIRGKAKPLLPRVVLRREMSIVVLRCRVEERRDELVLERKNADIRNLCRLSPSLSLIAYLPEVTGGYIERKKRRRLDASAGETGKPGTVPVKEIPEPEMEVAEQCEAVGWEDREDNIRNEVVLRRRHGNDVGRGTLDQVYFHTLRNQRGEDRYRGCAGTYDADSLVFQG